MDANIRHFITKQSQDRQNILTAIHSIISKEDNSVKPIVETMMGKEMIVYKGKGMMKYGLASMKNYMTLHCMPIYSSKTLFAKYKSLLPLATFQKGCINFPNADTMPLDIVKQLIVDCFSIDLAKIKEEYLKQKKATSSLRNK